ncbi:uncharacterized protein LOC102722415 isoform X2 [Oryza brachyantha]|uniref:uncharacterized protein LOC102722415 isoform X2 n=1 Tax=Oryza brachyantha TaxID=4533 RepID=UPI001ADB7122|nr:uncharacterized protein LOC102722415 isoform X2 [Oryza brachyantha]
MPDNQTHSSEFPATTEAISSYFGPIWAHMAATSFTRDENGTSLRSEERFPAPPPQTRGAASGRAVGGGEGDRGGGSWIGAWRAGGRQRRCRRPAPRDGTGRGRLMSRRCPATGEKLWADPSAPPVSIACGGGGYGSFCSPRLHRLRRWRQAALTLNASCRFRYTQDLEKEEEKEMIRRKIQAHLQVIRLVRLFGPAPPEVTVQRDQGGPPPCDPTFGRRDRKAGRDGGLPMGHPEPHKIRRLMLASASMGSVTGEGSLESSRRSATQRSPLIHGFALASTTTTTSASRPAGSPLLSGEKMG